MTASTAAARRGRTPGRRDGITQAFGGRAAEDVFTRAADVPELLRYEKVVQWFDVYIYAPFAVAWSDLRARIGLALVTLCFITGIFGPILVEKPDHEDRRPLQGDT